MHVDSWALKATKIGLRSRAVFKLDTSKIFICSTHPLELLYSSLLSLGNDLSLTINPSILNEAALLIIEPIFFGSVISSKQTKVRLFFFLINSLGYHI